MARGESGESLRLYAPDRALLFSSLDARLPGYPRALDIARAAGYEPVIRLAGGHAAVFLEQSLAFAWASADADAHLRIKPRFERLTGWFVEALRRLGLDARVGEIPGEYCPGEYSINLAGRIKVFGVGQRVIRGGAHVGGVLTVGQSPGLREILEPIYAALGLEFETETAGSLTDFEPSITVEDVVASLLDVLRDDGAVAQAAVFSEEIEHAAEQLLPMHDPERDPKAGAALRQGFETRGGKALVHSDEGN